MAVVGRLVDYARGNRPRVVPAPYSAHATTPRVPRGSDLCWLVAHLPARVQGSCGGGVPRIRGVRLDCPYPVVAGGGRDDRSGRVRRMHLLPGRAELGRTLATNRDLSYSRASAHD